MGPLPPRWSRPGWTPGLSATCSRAEPAGEPLQGPPRLLSPVAQGAATQAAQTATRRARAEVSEESVTGQPFDQLGQRRRRSRLVRQTSITLRITSSSNSALKCSMTSATVSPVGVSDLAAEAGVEP